MINVTELATLISRQLDMSDVKHAQKIEKNIPIYDCAALADHLDNPDTLKKEIGNNLLNGSGVVVLKGAYTDLSLIDDVSEKFLEIIAAEKEAAIGGGDHFAKPGANDRIWNSLEKLARHAPDLFVRYHANRWIQLASEAWLGPAYQMTAQVNLVYPGGAAQTGHCDYHMGFMTKEQALSYPAHIHATSAQLTLQGGIAHCDMSVESGPTKLLPFSQKWQGNYAGYREKNAQDLFEANYVQLPLSKGDLLFFSPGLMHAAGANQTDDVKRLVNLLQVGSAFGRSIESVNRSAMCEAVFEPMKAALSDGTLTQAEISATIASTGEGYPFPTNLDSDPPIGGMAPPSQQDIMHDGLRENWTLDQLKNAITERDAKKQP